MELSFLEQFKAYLSADDITNIKNANDEVINFGKTIKVACIGIYNNGKSSLLNVLVDDFEEKTFKVSDKRETTTSKEVAKNGFTYIDTPGLNENDQDDKVVFDTMHKSDCNLFVHNVAGGEFTEAEVKSLEKIKLNWNNPKDFINQTVFVLSRIDEIGNEADITNTENKMKEQIKKIYGVENPMFIAVFSKRYQKGKIESKQTLIDKSNIENLKNEIKNLSTKRHNDILKTKESRLNSAVENARTKIVNLLNSKKSSRDTKVTQNNNYDSNLNSDISSIRSTLSSKYRTLNNI